MTQHPVPSRTAPTRPNTVSLPKRLALAVGLVALLSIALVSPASSTETPAPTVGTWGIYPAQTYTDATTTTTGASYKTEVRAPINADGSSNFPAKRGVIPVQFNLLAAPTTTTTTTRDYAPPVWKSIGSEGSYTVATFTPSSALTFNDIANLSATYAFTTGTCGGGSLRWTVAVMHDGFEKRVHVYYGEPNSLNQECSVNSGSGQNLITTGATNRFEMQDFGGLPQYTTYDATQSVVGTDQVLWAALILDSGWKLDQRADVSNITVNNNTFVPMTTESTTVTTPTGPYVRTCALPAAEHRYGKNDATPTGGVNEDLSVQPKDTGEFYRQVDCKYIYNLAVNRLDGPGTYRVYANIDGANLEAPAKFDLR